MSERNQKPPRRGRGTLPAPPKVSAGNGDDEDVTEQTETFVLPGSMTPPPPTGTLTILAGRDAQRVCPLDEKTTWLGRGRDCNLSLRDSGVSRRHASITVVGRAHVLRDNRAKNGTFVNGRRVEEFTLRPGDEIQLGPNVSLLFSLGTGAAERLAQQQAARAQLFNERMYAGRMESLANIVTGLAHEINTPLGVANTANALIASLVDEVRRTEPGPTLDAIFGELKDSTNLMGRNLARASQLVRSFKQLSARQLSDDYLQCDAADIIRDAVQTMGAELTRRKIVVRTTWRDDTKFPWTGYPGHLSQVLVNLIENTMRYAYKGEEEGRIDLDLTAVGDTYRLEFRDAGAGIQPDIFSKIFEPFVTSGRQEGATGLGLAITHNIVTNILDGRITCASAPGKGTTFLITIPCSVPKPEESALYASVIPGRLVEC